MNTHDPSDIAPLSYGAGLALGLMLILGLPAEKKTPQSNSTPVRNPATGCRFAGDEVKRTPEEGALCG